MNIETLKYRILYNWNVMRVIRLVLGLAILGQAIAGRSIVLGLLAGIILFQAVTATGCCAAGGCSVPSRRYKKPKTGAHDLPAK